MLIGIPPLLGPDLLHSLRSMGHGDEIAIVDANYPAHEHARRLVRADGHGLLALVTAILAVLPLEAAPQPAILRAAQDNDPAKSGPIHREMDALCARLVPAARVQVLDGAQLYPRIRAAHTVVASGEMALYANVILRKGVIAGPPFPR
jgi:L-fucose mutarotase